MDILKRLTRGTKQTTNKAGNSSQITPTLPSASRPKPQLFHDHVDISSSKKRKREEVRLEDTPDEELSDIDFFAPKRPAKEVEEAKPTDTAQPRFAKRQFELLDEDECRQILRSHRLKLTAMSTVNEKNSKIKKKDKKKNKATAKATAKDAKRQLYTQPLTSFAELRSIFSISSRLAQNLERLHYRIPTEVQMASLPLLLNPRLALQKTTNAETLGAEDGVDFLAVAPTGSGKTLSFLIPAINDIMKRGAEGGGDRRHELHTVIVAPTRELAKQIANEGKTLVAGTGVRVVAMKKGMRVMAADDVADDNIPSASEDESSEDDEEGSPSEGTQAKPVPGIAPAVPVTRADILVTTPMLLLNFLSKGSTDAPKSIPTVRSLVLDEADALLDPLFEEQTLGIWTACTNPDLHVTFWSATMGSGIEALIAKQTKRHTKARNATFRPLIRLVVGLKDTAVPNITHKLIYTGTEPGKLLALRQLLHPSSSAADANLPALRPPFLVFTQTIERAAALHRELRYDIPLAAGGAARVAALHSGLSDAARAAVVHRFRAGLVWVLVTTDVLARGVDFAGVNAVVNYDVPGSAAAYVHRAGRTGRAGREGGLAVTLYTKDDIPVVRGVANVIAASERQAGRAGGEGSAVQQWLLDALPKVSAQDRKKLKERGVESRRGGAKAVISSKSGWERRRENNRRGAVVASKKRKLQDGRGKGGQENDGAGDEGWGGFDD